MANNGVSIKYGNIAPGAKEGFSPTASEAEFDTLFQLQRYNLNFPNYTNACEWYRTALDGTALPVPSDVRSANVGMWSEQISGEQGEFANPIVLTMESDGNYTSAGLTLTFDKQNSIFPTNINIHWYRVSGEETTDLGEKNFSPNDSVYFCENRVEAYNKIVITFYTLNMPKNRLILRSIDYGYGTFFYGNELRSIKLIQEIDPISAQVVINTADFVLDVNGDTEYSFQSKQPLSVYFNGELKATTFVKLAKRRSKHLWSIQSEDYIGLMDGTLYKGGIYTNYSAVDVLGDIFQTANVPYRIDEVFSDAKVTGYIPYTTCREALMQVAFAIQAVVDTSNVDFVNVYELKDSTEQVIPLNRIMQGQNFVDEEVVKAVEVTAHTFKKISEVKNVYDANESGIGDNILVRFSEPLHDLSITNGTIVSSGTNYAVINAQVNCTLKGQRYEHTMQTRQKRNPLVLASDTEKIISVQSATLVSPHNIDNVLEKCYNWFARTITTNLRIVEGKHEAKNEGILYGQVLYGMAVYGASRSGTVYDKAVNVGEVIEAETEYLGNVTGRIIKQSFNLNGGIIIKEASMR